MTPQESTMLNDLARKVQQTQLPEKDQEAEDFLQQNLGGNPDAMYILAQAVLVQNIALDRAKVQVQQLQQQLQEAQSHAQAQPSHTSFLGSLLGRHDAPPAPPAQNFPPRAAAPAPQYYPPAPSYAPDYSAGPPMGAPQGGGSSFLRSAATTAAGVAAGALAFEGVESLLHGFGGHGGGFGGGGFGERPEETVINNNYYDDPNQNLGGMQEHREHEASFDDRPGAGFGNDDQGTQLQDTSYKAGGDSGDLQNIDTLDDDQTTGGVDDDSNVDDSSNFDDSGSFDDGGGDDSSQV